MRGTFSVALIVTVLFAGGYFYYIAEAICPAPLEYSVGEIDESFHISFDEVRLALADAESVWEDATGQNLFIYNPDAPFTVNLIYDDRQAYADAEGNFKQRLDKTQDISDALHQTYAELVLNYDALQIEYSHKVDAYEDDLDSYNRTVAQYNQQGGADEETYSRLQKQKQQLDAQRTSLETLAQNLNILVEKINDIGDQGNSLIETYNRGVDEYNNTFGESREFTQGTYSSDKRIDIYTYADTNELRLVLAHELGHALSLDHVADEASVMYFLIGEQPAELSLTQNDMDEFIRVCSQKSFWSTIKALFNKN